MDRTLTGMLIVALITQLVLGACYRHLQIPATSELPAHHPAWAMHGHLSFSVVVLLLTIFTGLRCMKRTDFPIIRNLGHAILILVTLQFLLGIGALVAVLVRPNEAIPLWELISTSAHQANGALLLGVSTALAAMTHRQISGEDLPSEPELASQIA